MALRAPFGCSAPPVRIQNAELSIQQVIEPALGARQGDVYMVMYERTRTNT
jgi:hypothetical protein